MDKRSVVRRNLQWFRNSGIMRPADGFWGVGERIVITSDNAALEQINRTFYCQTRLGPNVVVLEHRRADCNFQAALLFDLAADAFGDPSCQTVANNLADYLVHRSGLRRLGEADAARDLWGWSNPLSGQDCWTDDNAWVATLLLVLARRDRPELKEVGIAAARALNRVLRPVAEHLRQHGRDVPIADIGLHGTNLSPHWLGLAAMALAHGAAADPSVDYTEFVRAYYECAIEAPASCRSRGLEPARFIGPREDSRSSAGLPWTMSEYGYLALAASIAARQFELSAAHDAARVAADALVAHQQDAGHFPAEYAEAPTAPHLADLVYTQNWATLGLYHAWLLFDRAPAYRRALDRSLEFLARIQDAGGEVWSHGCWRGLYDTRAGAWGGGNCWEGGQGSIYSGWTNAPIALAFLFDLTGMSLFASVF